ncbi:hypothetical protein RF819_11545 [Rhodoferax fermentans]|uniref:protein-tyrosine-phosphatase n=2 Tax=Rhodoferax fermentans TaxID=28066 RepID=A0A1T1AT46_RHOFE|nr:hypothetical protein RF819_11545 [Rhodoferax fermentans]
MPRYKALVIGDDTRSFLATVRSLGRQSIEVHAAPYFMVAPALQSKYITEVHRLPYYLNGGADWLQAIQQLVSAQRFDIIIPCEERSLLPLYKHQHELPSTCVLAIPNHQALDAFFDKLNTRQLATQLDVPVAKGRPLSEHDTTESILAELRLPIVVKQRKSYSWPDLYVRTSVKFIESRTQLDSMLPSLIKGCSDFFFEEIFAGRGLGVSVLCQEGDVLQAFEHHRVHELSGSSYYRKSVPLDPHRLAAVKRMVKAVAYTGVAMFEFKLDEQTGTWILLEVNARPWGSLPLPVSLGVDFPYQLFTLLVLKTTPPAVAYRPNVYGRNFFPDLWQLRAIIAEPLADKPRKLITVAKWAASFFRPVIGREHHDVFTWDDPRPAWLELKQFVQERRNSPPPRTESVLQRLRFLQRKKQAAIQIAFICQGNICRSPYAQIKASEIFLHDKNRFIFCSAGMLPRNQRASPPHAVDAAASRLVDLRNHRSTHANEDLIKNSDLFIIFDKKNYDSFQARYPERVNDVFFISDAVEITPKLKIIDDPDGLSIEIFQKTYLEIDGFLYQILSEIEKS